MLTLPLGEFNEDGVGDLLPPCLALAADPVLVVVANHSVGLGSGQSTAHHAEDTARELVVGISVVCDDVAGTFVLGGWIDNAAALAFGRELFGFPKRYAHVSATSFWPLSPALRGDAVSIAVVERGDVVARLSATLDADLDAGAAAGETFFAWRRLPRVDGDGLSVSEVLTASSRQLGTAGAWSATADIDINRWHDESWAPLLVRRATKITARVSVAERLLDWPRVIWQDSTIPRSGDSKHLEKGEQE